MARRRSDDTPLSFACDCGTVHGHLTPAAARGGTHAVCFCRDCRAAQLHLGQPDPSPDPVGQFQTTPDVLTIVSGAGRLGLFRLGPRGVLRWYATCCNAPMFNTLANPRLPFAGIHTARLADPDRIGPVRVRGFVPRAAGRTEHEGAMRMVWGLATRMLAAGLSGRWRMNPFVDPATKTPIARARILTRDERAALYPPARTRRGG